MKTKEIYPSSLNIYNRAWLNTYLAKTPILITVEFQELLEIFTGIFYLHLHSYSSLAKTWLLYETGFLSGLVFHIPLCQWSSVLQVFFLLVFVPRFRGAYFNSRQKDDIQTKISSEAGFGNSQPRLVTQASLSVTKPPGFAPIGHLHYDIILLLRPESFRVLLSCVN